MKIIKLLIVFFLIISNSIYCQIKTAENYIIQEITTESNPILIYFAGIYKLNTCGNFYIVSEKELLRFIKCNNIDNSKLILLLSKESRFIPKEVDEKTNYFLKDVSNLIHFFWLNETPVYKIADKLYAIRKIKYAYLESNDAFAPKCELLDYIYGDDQPICNDSTLVSAKKFFNVDYFQYFLYTIDTMKVHRKLNKLIWRKRYQLIEEIGIDK